MSKQTIQIPHGFTPRIYQLPIMSAFDGGCKRGVWVVHRRAGKDKTCWNILIKKAFERVAMEASFRNALSREEFIVYYQPQVNAEAGQIIGMEALVRWMHPDMGLISPAKFLSFANDTGLIIPMDQWVMETAMMQWVQWYRDGLKPGVLALNVSMRQLQKEDFVDTLQQLLEETGCQGEHKICSYRQ